MFGRYTTGPFSLTNKRAGVYHAHQSMSIRPVMIERGIGGYQSGGIRYTSGAQTTAPFRGSSWGGAPCAVTPMPVFTFLLVYGLIFGRLA